MHVVVANRETRDTETIVVLPSTSSPVEAVPGIWGTGDDQGILCVIGTDEFDTVLEPGTKVAEIHSASIQTRVCQSCGCQDTDAWIDAEEGPKCAGCGTGRVGGPAACRQCSASAEHCCVLGYAGCMDCRPEQKLRGRVRRGPAAGLLAKSALAFAALNQVDTRPQPCEPCPVPAAGAPPSEALDVKLHPVFHIVEEPGGIKHLTDCEVPTEEYNSARARDMAERHPNVSPGLLEHLEALEPFLDTSIVAGFSYGVSKASVVVTEGSLLGHRVSREGSSHESEKTDAIRLFAPLHDVTQVRQFVGSTNWVRRYLLPCYATAVKILGEYMKLGADFNLSLIHI